MKNVSSNVNRIDLLTDAKIGDIKNLMKCMSDQIVHLGKRLSNNEMELYKKLYADLPVDVMAITMTDS